MKIKLALVSLLIPTAVFAQAGKSGENAGYQGTTSATQGLGASNPNAGSTNAGYQGTTSATQGLGKNEGAPNQIVGPNGLPPGSGTPQPIGTIGPGQQIK
jgi:hypothetical protein